MSLINKLLKDIESRQTALPDGRDIVLDGLYSAYDVEIQQQESKKKYFYYLLAIFLFVALFILVGRIDLPSPAENPYTSSALFPAQPVINNSSTRGAVIIDEVKPEVENRNSGGAILSLKVDDVLANQENFILAREENIQHRATIENIALEEEAGNIILSMDIPVESQYVLYMLNNPYRAVLEIDNVDHAGSLPGIDQLTTISNIRKQLDDDGQFRFVIESRGPLSIENTRILQDSGQYKLQVSLQQQDQAVPAASEENIMTQIADTDKALSGDTNVMHGELVKTIHQPKVYSKTEKLLMEGLELYRQGKVAEGLDAFYAAVKNDESHVKARATLAVKLVEQDQRELAVTVLEEGLQLYPDRTEWSRLLAQTHIDAGNLYLAREVMEKSIPAISADPDYHALYAALLQKMTLHQQAALTYRNLLNVYPENGIWWMGLAISLEALSRNRDAIFAYSNALKGHSLTTETHQYIAQRIRILNQQIANESS